MLNKPDTPKNLREAFNRLMGLIPVPYRYEKNIQKTILIYLKVEGEEFVRNGIERTRELFTEKYQKRFPENRDKT
ncbi:MAG: hypothetical protein SRB2_01355 [Desulfobacteraceae bacterium Eth-SRB2]|nr:MAG: hypothetical protein SRB2_01355 [Desulfobacteraceae bacterium Eth-SRB2]